MPAKILARARGEGAIMCSRTKIKRIRKSTVTKALIPLLIRKNRIFGIPDQLQNSEDKFVMVVIIRKW